MSEKLTPEHWPLTEDDLSVALSGVRHVLEGHVRSEMAGQRKCITCGQCIGEKSMALITAERRLAALDIVLAERRERKNSNV